MPSRSTGRPRRESRPPRNDVPLFIRPMCPDDDRLLRDLVYKRILVTQCYDILLANLQKFNFHITIGLVAWTAYSFLPYIPFALITGVLVYPLFLFVLARFIILPIDAYFSQPNDLVLGMYEYWSKEAKGRTLLVGELNGKVVAMVAVQQVSTETAEIQRLATAAKFEKRGIGTTVMKSVINMCRDSEYSKLIISINETSLPARLLCRHAGFTETEGKTASFGFFKSYDYHMELNADRRQRAKRGNKRAR